MSRKTVTGRADKRYPTRHPGITFRPRQGGQKTYYVTVGSRHLRVDGDEQEALLVQAHLRSNKGRGLRITPPKKVFADMAEEWFERGKGRWARSTAKGYRITLDSHVLPVFGHIPIAKIGTDDVARFIEDRRNAGAEESYIAANLRPLNGTFKLALRQGLITTNPMTALLTEERPKPKQRKRRTWTPEDIKRLVDAARTLGSRVGPAFDYTALIIVAIYTGMRVGELLGLRWQDVDLDGCVVRVRHQICRETRTLIPPKTEAGIRDIPLPPSLVRFLRRYRMGSTFSQGDHFVFCSKTGAPLDRGNVRSRGFGAAVDLAGLNRPGEPKLTTHDLRHAFASVVAHHGFAAVDVAVFMGHNDSRVTEAVYIHPYNKAATATRLREVVEAAMQEQVLGGS